MAGKVTTDEQPRGAGAGTGTAVLEPDYLDGNSVLFLRRRELHERLAELDRAPGSRRDAARLRRAIEDVTAEIVQFNRGLVRSYCRRFTAHASRDESADFEAAGMLGLMRAIDSFDPAQGRFGSWAFKPIQREVLRAVRDADHPNVNISDFERRPEILRAVRQLQQDDGNASPSHDDIAAVAGATVEQVRRVLMPPKLESVDATGSDGHDGADVTLVDNLPSSSPGPEAVVLSAMMLAALRTHGLTALDSRELAVIVRRFGLDGEEPDKLAKIGEVLGLSREAVRQIEAKAIAKLQHPMVLRKIQRHGRD